MNEDIKPLTAADLVPSPGIEPVIIRLWSEASDNGALHIALVVPESQVGTSAAAAGRMLLLGFAQLMDEVPIQVQEGKVH